MDRSRKDCLTFCLWSLCVFKQEVVAGDVLLVQVVKNEALGVCGDGSLSLVMVCSKTHPDFSGLSFLGTGLQMPQLMPRG